MNKIQERRLLNVARALRETKEPGAFDMSLWAITPDVMRAAAEDETEGEAERERFACLSKFDCGTPACALGQYAARRDLQRAFAIRISDGYAELQATVSGLSYSYDYSGAAERHFGLTDKEFYELFGEAGCGAAKTPKRAARYIERFAARKAARS